jgi:hypothetical protein
MTEFKSSSRSIFRFMKLFQGTARFQVIKSLLLQIEVFRDVTWCLLLDIYRRQFQAVQQLDSGQG